MLTFNQFVKILKSKYKNKEINKDNSFSGEDVIYKMLTKNITYYKEDLTTKTFIEDEQPMSYYIVQKGFIFKIKD